MFNLASWLTIETPLYRYLPQIALAKISIDKMTRKVILKKDNCIGCNLVKHDYYHSSCFNIIYRITLSLTPKDPIPTEYTMNNLPLISPTNMNDLGIIIAKNLKWSDQINKIISKANQRLWLTIRTLGYDAAIKAKKLEYISMVRSILEYNSPIWSPQDKDNLKNLERCQRKATNFIVSNAHRTMPNYKDYYTRLIECNLLPFSYRREITDIITFCRAYNDDLSYNIKDYIEFNNPGAGRITRRQTNSDTLKIPNTKTTQAAHFYPTRIARLVNSLPQNLHKALKPL